MRMCVDGFVVLDLEARDVARTRTVVRVLLRSDRAVHASGHRRRHRHCRCEAIVIEIVNAKTRDCSARSTMF